MCREIYFKKDKEHCGCTNELIKKGIEVIYLEDYISDGENSCLCVVDIEKTLDKAGYTWNLDDWCDYVAVRKIK